MVNEIINGIAKAVKAEFPESKKTYIDEIEQGMAEEINRPCFFIALLDASQEQHLGRRLWREHNFNVHYFPQNEGSPNREINTVLDQLRLALRFIDVKEDSGAGVSKIAGTDMRHEVVDGVLHFFVSFNLFVLLSPSDNPYMETVDHEQRIKEAE